MTDAIALHGVSHRFGELIKEWPVDIRDHVMRLAFADHAATL